MTNHYIDEAINRFLAWELPADFSPDAGISFEPPKSHAAWPTGTNLFSAQQVEELLYACIPELPKVEPYLKQGESISQCIGRNRADVVQALHMLAGEKNLTEQQVQHLILAQERHHRDWEKIAALKESNDDYKALLAEANETIEALKGRCRDLYASDDGEAWSETESYFESKGWDISLPAQQENQND